MKSFTLTIGLFLFTLLSFSQTHQHIDRDLSGTIFDAKEKGLYSLEQTSNEEKVTTKIGLNLTKYSYDLVSEWTVTVASDRKLDTRFEGFLSKDRNFFFVLNSMNKKFEVRSVDSMGIVSKTKEVTIEKGLAVLHVFSGEDFLNVLVGEWDPKHKAGKTEIITWYRISSDGEVDSKIIEVPSPNYTRYKFYWKPFGNNGEELFFSAVYLNKSTNNTLGAITEFMSIGFTGEVFTKELTKDMYLSPEFVNKTISKVYHFTYSYELDRFYMQKMNKDKASFDIASFDLKGNMDWRITHNYNGKLSFVSTPTRFYSSFNIFDNGMLGYKLLQPRSSELGQVFLFGAEDGETINNIEFPFTSFSNVPGLSGLIMYVVPDGQAVNVVTDMQEAAKKKKDLKGVSYDYSKSGDDELLFIYTEDGTDMYRFTE